MSITLTMHLYLEIQHQEDGRWLVSIDDLQINAQGDTKRDAILEAKVFALRAIADRIEHREDYLHLTSVNFSEVKNY